MNLAALAEVGTAAWVTITAAAVTGLFGLIAGTATGAFVTTRHERAESARERLLSAAEDYLSSYDKTSAAFFNLGHWLDEAVAGDARKDIDFYEIVERRVGRSAMVTKFLTDVVPLTYELRRTGRRTKLVFPKTSNVAEPIDAIYDRFSDESKLYEKQIKTYEDFDEQVTGFEKQRGEQVELFVERAREATVVRTWRWWPFRAD